MKNTDRYLYKAKRIDDGVWIEGSLIISDERYFICPIFGVKSIDDVTNRCGNLMLQIYACEVDSSTLCQFTGLTDINENMIWENDIVLYDDEYWCISWSNQDACFVFEQNDFIESFSNIWGKDCEVYGNIFDNKELLPTYETDHYKTYEKEYMRMHIETEEDLNKLDGSLDLYEASNHYPPYIVCSEETKQMLNKYKDRFPLIKDIKEYQGLDMYYFVKIKVDNDLPFGEVEIR